MCLDEVSYPRGSVNAVYVDSVTIVPIGVMKVVNDCAKRRISNYPVVQYARRHSRIPFSY